MPEPEPDSEVRSTPGPASTPTMAASTFVPALPLVASADAVSDLLGREEAPLRRVIQRYVRDAATAMILAMERGRPGERYLVGGANMTLEAFLGRLQRISGVPGPRFKAPRSLALARVGAGLLERAARRMHREPPLDRISAEMSAHFWYVDSTRARTELGWTSRDPNDTLAETIADLRDRGVVWPSA